MHTPYMQHMGLPRALHICSIQNAYAPYMPYILYGAYYMLHTKCIRHTFCMERMVMYGAEVF